MPAAGPALCLSRLLDRREPQNGLQGALPGAGAAVPGRMGAVYPVQGIISGRYCGAPRGRHLDPARPDTAMTIGVLSSTLFGGMFGTEAMRASFGEMAFLARCAEVEAARARAQARLGIVPADAAAAITQAAAAIAADPSLL